jgi:hypothetical protein
MVVAMILELFIPIDPPTCQSSLFGFPIHSALAPAAFVLIRMELVVAVRVAAVIIMIIIDNDINMVWFISTELGFFNHLYSPHTPPAPSSSLFGK